MLRGIATPDVADEERRYIGEADWASLRSRQALTAERLVSASGLLPVEARNRALYQSAFAASEGLKAYADAIPPEDQLERPVEIATASDNTFWSELRRQAQLAVLAFKTGVAVSADMWLRGFDTHDTHDADQGALLANLTDSVDYLWDYAEVHGVADRLVVVMGSDFGRTNFYNSDERQGPLADRQLHRHGEEPALDEPRGRIETDGPALRAANQPCGHLTVTTPTARSSIPSISIKALRRYLGIEKLPGRTTVPVFQHRGLRIFRLKRDQPQIADRT